MNCAYHAEAQSLAFCIRCGRALCNECVHNVRGSVYCENCLAEIVQGGPAGAGSAASAGQASKPPRAYIGGTNPGAAFALGLIPGVGAIYNGEYFKAAAHILIFGMLVSINDTVRTGEALFGLLTAGFYFYMAFEAYYTAKKRKLRLEGVELETPFDRFNEQIEAVKNKELWGGLSLVIIGSLFLLDNFDVIRMDQILRLWPIALIVVGVWLLKRFQEKEA